MKKILFVILCIFISLNTFAQHQNYFKKLIDERDKKVVQLKADYSKYIKEQDNLFYEFLKETWGTFEILTGKTPPNIPKPKQAPVATGEDEDIKAMAMSGMVTSEDSTMFYEKPIITRYAKCDTLEYNKTPIDIEFYGKKFILYPSSNLLNKYNGQINEEGVATYWKNMCENSYDNILDQLYNISEQMGLNDWGRYLLINSFAIKSSEDINTQQLLTWFILTKMGYKADIGFEEDKIALLLPTMQEIYFRPFVVKNGVNYYLMRDLKNVKTYNANSQIINKYLDLRFYSTICFPEEFISERKTTFRGKDITLSYNKKAIEFYKDYPATELEVYFNAPLSSAAKDCLVENLDPLLKEMSVKEKVAFLLAYMHESFPYKTDMEQFGYEKYFFAEEALAYPYSDCEDRSILFSYLVRNLAGLPVIGLNYDGHVSTAVQIIDTTITGTYWNYMGERYLSCDPTYIGAQIGLVIEKYRTQMANIIPVSDYLISKHREETIYNLIESAGGIILNPYKHIAIDNLGNIFVTGIFEKQFKYSNNVIPSPNGSKSIFLCKINDKDQFEWVLPFGGEKNDYPQQLKLNKNLLLLSGTFEDIGTFGKNLLTAKGDKDLFLACITSNGNVEWASNCSFDQKEISEDYNYVASFNSNGEVLQSNCRPNMPSLFKSGISITQNNEYIVSGVFNEWDGIRKLNADTKLDLSTTQSIVEELRKQYNLNITNKVEHGISGLLAAIYLVNQKGIPISGDIVVQALDKYNPSFKQKCPKIYSNIKRINILKNEEGMIILKTSDGKSVSFDKVKVKTDSKMKLVNMPDNNIKVDIISGIVVGKAVIWFPLNNVVLYEKTGDMLFDYDKDHTKRTFNLTADILN
ncbi:MAG: hypothetical protein RR312_02135 [Bacteroidales bacterium]